MKTKSDVAKRVAKAKGVQLVTVKVKKLKVKDLLATPVVKLNERQIELAAMSFTTSNLGQDQPGMYDSSVAVEQAYRRCEMNHGVEGIDISDEYQDWLKKLKKGDAWTTNEALKRMPWLTQVG